MNAAVAKRSEKMRMTAKDPAEQLAHGRFSVLELTERLAKITKTRRRGGTHVDFGGIRRRLELGGETPPVLSVI